MRTSILRLSLCVLALAWGTSASTPQNRTTTGEFIIEPPTLINLGFEWHIQGDDNRNAQVEVRYRKKGATTWETALPLLRLNQEHIFRENFLDVVVPNMFAGSILDLEPATEYECEFTLKDPDGSRGATRKVVIVRTRPEPMASTTGRTFHVYPHGFKGTKQEPAFEGLLCAYYLTCSGTDWATAARPRVKPGDTILVHSGTYKYDRFEYTNNLSVSTVPFDGTYYLTASGTAEKPIVIKAAGDGEVIFDGGGNHTLFNLMGASYNYFEGITFRNTNVAIDAGKKRIAGGEGLTVKKSKFLNVGIGISNSHQENS